MASKPLVSCISPYSYIKPQPEAAGLDSPFVVYLLIPTSNRNYMHRNYGKNLLYIFLFLHQTATVVLLRIVGFCCISSYSYIKPQLFIVSSNKFWVVYLLIPTSNRNAGVYGTQIRTLYIFLFLHQTATNLWNEPFQCRCISSYSYIKPQLGNGAWLSMMVVYLLIPTSNRNNTVKCKFKILLYIFLFLHQTATTNTNAFLEKELYIFLFLHQTATLSKSSLAISGCISSYSYIKPQQPDLEWKTNIVVYLLIPTSNRNIKCW